MPVLRDQDLEVRKPDLAVTIGVACVRTDIAAAVVAGVGLEDVGVLAAVVELVFDTVTIEVVIGGRQRPGKTGNRHTQCQQQPEQCCDQADLHLTDLLGFFEQTH